MLILLFSAISLFAIESPLPILPDLIMHSYNHRREATGSVAEPRQKNDSLFKTYSGTHNLGTLDHTDGTLNDVWRGQGSQKSLSDHLADEVVRPVHQDQVRSDARSSDWRRRGSSQHRMSARKEYGQVRHESDMGAFHPNDQLASYEDPCLRPDHRQLFDQAESAQHKKGSDSTFKSYQPLRSVHRSCEPVRVLIRPLGSVQIKIYPAKRNMLRIGRQSSAKEHYSRAPNTLLHNRLQQIKLSRLLTGTRSIPQALGQALRL